MMRPFRVVAEVGLVDGVGLDDVFWFAAGALTVCTLGVFLLRKPLRSLLGFIRWMGKFREDWDGVVGDAGHITIPGVMQRMNNIDGEVTRNGGKSMKDMVVKTAESLAALDKTVARLDDTLTAVVGTVDEMHTRQTKMEGVQGEIKAFVDAETERHKEVQPTPVEG